MKNCHWQNLCASLLFCLGLLLPAVTFAQEDVTKESLEAQLTAISADSPERIPVLAQLLKLCWRKCPKEAKGYGDEAVALLKQYPDPQSHSTVATYLPRLYILSGDSDTALEITEAGIEAAAKLDDATPLAAIQFNQAAIYSHKQQYILSERAYQKLFETYRRLEHAKGMGATLNNLAYMKSLQNNYGEALALSKQALEIYSNAGNSRDMSVTYTNIADVYNNLGEYQKALESVTKALELIEVDERPVGYIAGLIRTGDTYRKLNDPSQAAKAYSQGLILAQNHGIDAILYQLYRNLAWTEVDKGHYERAQEFYHQAEKAFLARESQEANTELEELAATLAIHQDDYALAEEYLMPVVEKILEGDSTQNNLDSLHKMIDVLIAQDKWQEALDLYKLYIEKYQEHIATNRESRLEQFDALFQASEKELKIAELEKSNNEQSLNLLKEQTTKKQTILIAIIVSIVLFVLIVLGVQKRKMLRMQTQLLQSEAEKKRRLFSDISHELRTPLAVLKLQLEGLEHNLVEDPKQTYQLLHAKLASINHLLTDISHLAQADAGDLDLKFEKVVVKEFFEHWCEEFASLPAEKGLSFDYRIDLADDDTCVMDPERIKQVLNNLLSNSCRYTDAPGNIKFRVRIKGKELQWKIEDSSPGLSPEQLPQIFERLYRADKSRSRKSGGSGLGLTICLSFITAHQGTINATASELGGICVDVTMPLERQEESHD